MLQGIKPTLYDGSRGNTPAGWNSPAPSPEKKARKTPDEPGCRSTVVLWSLLIFIPPFPVKYSGVIFVMGILVRGMGSGEQARG